MSQIMQAIRRVNDIMSEIAAASAEQTRGIGEVGEAIVQMDTVTQQNAALVEQAAAAAQSLAEQATRLKQAVSVFKLADTGSLISQAIIPQDRPRLPRSKLPTTNARSKAAVRSTTITARPAEVTTAGEAGETWESF